RWPPDRAQIPVGARSRYEPTGRLADLLGGRSARHQTHDPGWREVILVWAGRSPGPPARPGCEERPSSRTALVSRLGHRTGSASEPSFTGAPRHSFVPLVPIS